MKAAAVKLLTQNEKTMTHTKKLEEIRVLLLETAARRSDFNLTIEVTEETNDLFPMLYFTHSVCFTSVFFDELLKICKRRNLIFFADKNGVKAFFNNRVK